jgi:hypothetical protein
MLYAMVWLAFFQIVIIIIPRFTPYLVHAHVTLGFVILVMAHVDLAQIRKTEAPNRLKRIIKSTAVLATIQPVLGIILFANATLNANAPFIGVVSFLHLVTALAIIAQAASVATAYDMWEEREYISTPKD